MPPVIQRLPKKISIVIRTDDHGSPHVHVLGPDAEAKIYLDGTVDRSHGFSERALRLLSAHVLKDVDEFRDAWFEIHGDEE